MSTELAVADSWLPADYMAATGISCADCGLTPANVNQPRRPDPSTALLEPAGVNHADRAACAIRQRLTPA